MIIYIYVIIIYNYSNYTSAIFHQVPFHNDRVIEEERRTHVELVTLSVCYYS